MAQEIRILSLRKKLDVLIKNDACNSRGCPSTQSRHDLAFWSNEAAAISAVGKNLKQKSPNEVFAIRVFSYS